MSDPTWLDQFAEDQKTSFDRMLLDKDHPDAVQDIVTGRWMESDAAFRKRIRAELAKREKDSK